MKLYLLLFSFLPCSAMDHTNTPINLPKPFVINRQMPRSSSEGYMSPYEVAKRSYMTADIYKKKGKTYLQITLYFKSVQIMQNDYEIDPREVAKL